MRNFRPVRLGESFFDWIGTSPGRIDPETGEFVESTAIPPGEREGFFDWLEVTPGRVNPKTGKLVIPTNIPKEEREKLKKAHGMPERRDWGKKEWGERGEGALSTFPQSDRIKALMERRASEKEGESVSKKEEGVFDRLFGPKMNGPKVGCGPYEVGCGTCGEMEMGDAGGDGGPGAALLLLFLGTTAVVALEALGMTNWSQPKK